MAQRRSARSLARRVPRGISRRHHVQAIPRGTLRQVAIELDEDRPEPLGERALGAVFLFLSLLLTGILAVLWGMGRI